MFLPSPSDLFKIKKQSFISSLDKEVLLDFYAPIIGLKAASLYILLLHEEGQEEQPFSNILSTFHLTQGDFSQYLDALEAIGLLKAFIKKTNNINHLLFVLYSPKSPEEFLGNDLLLGLLDSYLEPVLKEKLKKKYSLEKLNTKDYEDISTSFTEYFSFSSLNASLNENKNETYLGHHSAPLSLAFDQNVFFESLKEELPSFEESDLSKEEKQKISSLATLYNYDEVAMASMVSRCFEPLAPLGERLNINCLRDDARRNISLSYLKNSPIKQGVSLTNGDNSMAKMIRRMDTCTPIEFLTQMQKGHKPAASDIKIVDKLTIDTGVPLNVVNAIVFFVLTTNDNILNAAYCEKLGASLVREGIDNALDAYNYLLEGPNKKRNYRKNNKTILNNEEKTSIATNCENNEKVVNNEEDDGEALEEMLKMIGE